LGADATLDARTESARHPRRYAFAILAAKYLPEEGYGCFRRIPKPQPLANSEFSTIRLRLLKIAARVKETSSRVSPAFSADCPDAALFRGLIGTLILRPT
jgi:DDE family transposase